MPVLPLKISAVVMSKDDAYRVIGWINRAILKGVEIELIEGSTPEIEQDLRELRSLKNRIEVAF